MLWVLPCKKSKPKCGSICLDRDVCASMFSELSAEILGGIATPLISHNRHSLLAIGAKKRSSKNMSQNIYSLTHKIDLLTFDLIIDLDLQMALTFQAHLSGIQTCKIEG